MRPKILITYANAGAGHRKASEAIYHAFLEIQKDVDVTIVDSLDYTNKFFKWFYPWLYLFLVNRAPVLWGFFYYITDWFYPLFWPFRRLTNFTNSKKFVAFLCDNKFDVVVTTHFFPTEVISSIKKKGKISTKLVCVVTDFGLHATWVSRQVDDYIVGTQETKSDLVKRGIEPDRITVLGIPVEKKFAQDIPKSAMRDKLGLSEDKFCILIVGGGFGVGPIEELVRGLGTLDSEIELVVVCGKNEELCTHIKNLSTLLKNKIIVYGYSENMDELMSAADIIITKPGGLSISEALSKTLPIITISPIMGQETKNCNLLMKHNAAICIRNATDAQKIILDFLNLPQTLNNIKENIKKISRPNAAGDIAKFVISKYCEHNK